MQTGNMRLAPHYEIGGIDSIEELKLIFHKDVDYEHNWLFASTSGVHGSYASIDDLEWADEDYQYARDNNELPLTILVIYPRLCTLLYGEINVLLSDLEWLRNVISRTIDAVESTQYFNTTLDWRAADPERWNRGLEHNRKWLEHVKKK